MHLRKEPKLPRMVHVGSDSNLTPLWMAVFWCRYWKWRYCRKTWWKYDDPYRDFVCQMRRSPRTCFQWWPYRDGTILSTASAFPLTNRRNKPKCWFIGDRKVHWEKYFFPLKSIKKALHILRTCIYLHPLRRLANWFRAPALQAGGHWFESVSQHKRRKPSLKWWLLTS